MTRPTSCPFPRAGLERDVQLHTIIVPAPAQSLCCPSPHQPSYFLAFPSSLFGCRRQSSCVPFWACFWHQSKAALRPFMVPSSPSLSHPSEVCSPGCWSGFLTCLESEVPGSVSCPPSSFPSALFMAGRESLAPLPGAHVVLLSPRGARPEIAASLRVSPSSPISSSPSFAGFS